MGAKGVLSLMAAVVLAGAVAACNGGEDAAGGYDFSGRWDYASVVTESTTSVPVGHLESRVLLVSQEGERITLQFEGSTSLTLTGSCDRVARTFSATGVLYAPPVRILYTIAGAARDEGAMEGTFSQQVGLSRVAGTWMADLMSR